MKSALTFSLAIIASGVMLVLSMPLAGWGAIGFVLLNICFDSCFPWTMRETALKGADVIALSTLDPQSPNGFIQSAHAAFTPFRAAEVGIPIVRAEQTAWSMVVDGSGKILGMASVGFEGSLARSVAKSSHPTLYR